MKRDTIRSHQNTIARRNQLSFEYELTANAYQKALVSDDYANIDNLTNVASMVTEKLDNLCGQLYWLSRDG